MLYLPINEKVCNTERIVKECFGTWPLNLEHKMGVDGKQPCLIPKSPGKLQDKSFCCYFSVLSMFPLDLKKTQKKTN